MCQHQFQLNNCEPFPSCAPLPHNELHALLEPHGRWSARAHAQSCHNMQAWFRRATPLLAEPSQPCLEPITLLQAWGMQAACGKISHCSAFILARPPDSAGDTSCPRPGLCFVAVGAFKLPPHLPLLFYKPLLWPSKPPGTSCIKGQKTDNVRTYITGVKMSLKVKKKEADSCSVPLNSFSSL